MKVEDCTRPGVPLVRLHGFHGPVFWPLSRVAMARLEWGGRLEVTSADGEVAHRPEPLDGLPEIAPGVRVHPAHVALDGEHLRIPGGWTLPAADLPPAPPVPEADPTARLAALRRDGGYAWLTPRGEEPGPATRGEALGAQPDLVRAGPHLVRPGAVRALVRRRKLVAVILEGGQRLEVDVRALAGLAAALGLAWPDPLDGVPAAHRRVYQCRLRDWPADLLSTPLEELRRRCAEDPVQLVWDVIWEAVRRPGGASNPRGLFYNPLRLLAQRLGIRRGNHGSPRLRLGGADRGLQRLLPVSLPRPGVWDDDELWRELQLRLDEFVGEWRLVTYEGLRFEDKGQGNRLVGEVRPDVVLVVEKTSLERDARRVAEGFGVSMLVLGGVPTWIATEFFARNLRTRTAGPVLLVSFCDHDPFGWGFPTAFAAQLERYGVATRGLVRLVKPSCFTPEELEIVALDLTVAPNQRRLVEEWVRESGGVNGRAQGIYADFLRPLERVIEAFRRETGLEPVREASWTRS